MKSLFSVLNQAEIIEDSLTCLCQKNNSHIHIQGPSGSGKTSIAFAIAEAWKSIGGKVLVARCDENRQDMPFESLKRLVLYQSIAKHLEYSALEGLKVAEKFIGTYGLVGKLYGEVSKINLDKVVQESKFSLSDKEASLIFEIKSKVRESPFLMIFDDSQNIDSATLIFLKKLRKNYRLPGYDQLIKGSVIFVSTSDANSIKKPTSNSIKSHTDFLFETRYCDKDRTKLILMNFGLNKELSKEAYKKIHEITSGHLRLLREVACYLSAKGGDINEIIKSEEKTDIARIIVEKVLSEKDPENEKRISLTLKCASIIGENSSIKELSCLTHGLVENSSDAIEKAEEMLLFQIKKTDLSFTHSCIHNYFKSLSIFESKPLHQKFSNCLKFISPQDYGVRAIHLELAGDFEEASSLWVMEWLKALRENPSLSISDVASREIQANILPIFTQLSIAIRHYHDGDFPSMREHLERLDFHHPKILCAERNYLYALSLSLTKSSYSRRKALSILNLYENTFKDEIEIGYRIKFLQIYLLMHLGQKEKALEEESCLMNNICENFEKEPIGLYYSNVLNRRSESIYPDEIAVVKQKEAQDYWMGESEDDFPRFPQEYYRTTSNLCATLLYLNRYEESVVNAEKVIRSRYFRNGGIQRPEYILNNHNVACFISEKKSPSECFDLQIPITSAPKAEYDNLITLSNLAVFSAYCGKEDRAVEILSRCWKDIKKIPDFEVFFKYLISTNLYAICSRINHECDIDIDYLQSITDAVDPDGFGYESYRLPYLIRSREENLENEKMKNIKDWDEEPTKDNYHLGPGWLFFGRRLLLSGIHSWVDI